MDKHDRHADNKQSKSAGDEHANLSRRTVLLGTTALATAVAAGAVSSGPAKAEDVLPPAEPQFHGQIGTYYTDSKPDIPALPSAPEGAPNILLVLVDDVGFGHTSTFGGPVNTPVLQKLAEGGLRYNRFHTTALCSPTRHQLQRRDQ
jgi:hypothetical protein